MAYQTTQGIVLRRSDYRDNDRVLTLLTPERGRVDVTARGCRKPKSPILAASDLFAMGEYVLYRGKGHEMITGCELTDSFYPLRTDIALLSHASLMLSAAEAVAQREEPAEHLFLLLGRSLARLSYGQGDPEPVTAAYLLHLMGIAGYRPDLSVCAQCGQVLAEGDAAHLVPEPAGLICPDCLRSARPNLSYDTLAWLREVQTRGIDKTHLPPQNDALAPLLVYAQHHLERRLPAIMGHDAPV